MAKADRHRTHPVGETTGTEERPAQHLVGTILNFDLDREIAQLHREQAWEQGDHNAITLVKDGELRVILVAMKRGALLPEHHAPARIAIQTLEGRLQMRTPEQTVELAPKSFLSLEAGLAHEVEALAESAFLIYLAWSEDALHPLERKMS